MLTYSTARELTLDAAQAARSSRSSTKTPPAAQIKKLLDSRNDREVLDGLRKVISVCVLPFGRKWSLGRFRIFLRPQLRGITIGTMD